MPTKNRYARYARLSEDTLKRLVHLFVLGENATSIARQTRVNRNSINRYLNWIRTRLAEECEKGGSNRDIHDYDMYFHDLRGTRTHTEAISARSLALYGCPETGMVVVRFFTLEEWAGLWQTQLARMRQHPRQWRCYEDFGYQKLFRACWDDTPREPYDPRDILETFWESAKERIVALRGVRTSVFHLHLRECQFRFNQGNRKLSPVILEMLRHQTQEGRESRRETRAQKQSEEAPSA